MVGARSRGIRSRMTFISLTLSLVALAGCVSPAGDDDLAPAGFSTREASADPHTGEQTSPAPDVPHHAETGEVGSIGGIVVAEDFAPVAGASLALEGVGIGATSNPDGSFLIVNVPAGTHVLRARADGYANKTTTVSVVDGVETKVELVMSSLGTDAARIDKREFAGFFECSLTYLIVTGDCFAPVTLVAETRGLDQYQSPTNAAYSFNFSVARDWRTIVMELVWENAPAMTSGEMQIHLEPEGGDNLTEADAYAVTGGKSPVRLVILPGVDHETTQAGDHRVNSNGEDLRARIFLQGAGHAIVCDPNSGRCFLGLGAAAQQRFTLYVSTFYGGPAPAEYSVVDSA